MFGGTWKEFDELSLEQKTKLVPEDCEDVVAESPFHAMVAWYRLQEILARKLLFARFHGVNQNNPILEARGAAGAVQ